MQVRQKLLNTRRRMEEELAGHPPSEEDEWFQSTAELAKPLLACYWSLWQSGAGMVWGGDNGIQPANPAHCRNDRSSLLRSLSLASHYHTKAKQLAKCCHGRTGSTLLITTRRRCVRQKELHSATPVCQHSIGACAGHTAAE